MPTGAPDYYKRILLYGLYNGAATPLACDEQGRLILVTEPVSPFKKSGTILLRDGFSTGITIPVTKTGGTGASVAVDTSEAASDGISCKLTGGSDGSLWAYLVYYLFPRSFNKLGVEFKARFGDYISKVEVEMRVFTGEYYYRAWWLYKWDDQVWQVYLQPPPQYVDIVEDAIFDKAQGKFYPLKFVIDVPNDQYVSLTYPGTEVDLTQYNIFKSPSTDDPHVRVFIKVVSQSGQNGVLYIDDVILTQDES